MSFLWFWSRRMGHLSKVKDLVRLFHLQDCLWYKKAPAPSRNSFPNQTWCRQNVFQCFDGRSQAVAVDVSQHWGGLLLVSLISDFFGTVYLYSGSDSSGGSNKSALRRSLHHLQYSDSNFTKTHLCTRQAQLLKNVQCFVIQYQTDICLQERNTIIRIFGNYIFPAISSISKVQGRLNWLYICGGHATQLVRWYLSIWPQIFKDYSERWSGGSQPRWLKTIKRSDFHYLTHKNMEVSATTSPLVGGIFGEILNIWGNSE